MPSMAAEDRHKQQAMTMTMTACDGEAVPHSVSPILFSRSITVAIRLYFRGVSRVSRVSGKGGGDIGSHILLAGDHQSVRRAN